MDREEIDLESFVRAHVTVLNSGGGRGYDEGVRTFDCPFCGDTKGRGWVGVEQWGAGCFNSGCTASPQLAGGAVDWGRHVLGLPTRAAVWLHLIEHYGGRPRVVYAKPKPRGSDFCRLPPMHAFTAEDPPFQQREFLRFINFQWGLGLADAIAWELGWCTEGRHASRVVIPIRMAGMLVGFQSRIVGPGEPKYVTSKHGLESDPEAECGRAAAAMLFNVGMVVPDADVLLVEGAGDVMGWHARGFHNSGIPAVGILGTALTPQKMKLLSLRRPRRVIVALDQDARRRALAYVADLRLEGLEGVLGEWVGGKDAGSGAHHVVAHEVRQGWPSLGGRVRAWLQPTDSKEESGA